jgi:hypothetical protein
MGEESIRSCDVQLIPTMSAGLTRAVWLPTTTLYTCLGSPQIRTRCAMWGEVESCILSDVRRNEVFRLVTGDKSWASGHGYTALCHRSCIAHAVFFTCGNPHPKRLDPCPHASPPAW